MFGGLLTAILLASDPNRNNPNAYYDLYKFKYTGVSVTLHASSDTETPGIKKKVNENGTIFFSALKQVRVSLKDYVRK